MSLWQWNTEIETSMVQGMMNIDKDRVIQTFCDLVSIDAPSYGERAMADALRARLMALDIPVTEDNAGDAIGGNAGNLIARVPATTGLEALPPILFSSHMDTVSPAIGKRAIVHEDGRITSAGDTVLGADDAAGLAAILEALTVLREQGIPHRALELVFPVAEEPYTKGTHQLDYSQFHACAAYVPDLDGEIGTAANVAPTIIYFRITVQGRAAHAGMNPEDGIHAIQIAARAIASLRLGAVDDMTTVNIGTIGGGAATNIVPERCVLEGEVRGFDHQLALAHLEEIRKEVTSIAEAYGAALTIDSEVRTVAYHEPEDSAAAERFIRACRKAGLTPGLRKTFGGSDNNTFEEHGIPGLVIASAMHNCHSTTEYTYVQEIVDLTTLLLSLMTDTE